jgi:hypothetical protein
MCTRDGLVRNFARSRKQDVVDHIHAQHKSVLMIQRHLEELKKQPVTDKTPPVPETENQTVVPAGQLFC